MKRWNMTHKQAIKLGKNILKCVSLVGQKNLLILMTSNWQCSIEKNKVLMIMMVMYNILIII